LSSPTCFHGQTIWLAPGFGKEANHNAQPTFCHTRQMRQIFLWYQDSGRNFMLFSASQPFSLARDAVCATVTPSPI
jgi:hypothetical protein